MNKSELEQLPDMVLVDDEPIFSEPWEAQAFAMAVHLHQQGVFTWTEWAQELTRHIHGNEHTLQGKETVTENRSYYQHWLAALETIVASKNITTAGELDQRRQAWLDAASRTPHGDPIELN